VLAQRQGEVQALKAEIARLDRTLAQDQARVAQRSTGNAELAAHDRQLQGKLAAARSDLGKLQDRLSAGVSPSEYVAVRHRYQSLQAAIAALQKELYGG
jgi:chromosome segregation ATPase